MNILQASSPKSGSYWLYKILNLILEKGGYPLHSFIQQQPIFREAQNWKLSYREQASVDMMDIEDDGFFYRISSAWRQAIPDINEYARSCSQAWTHSTFCQKSPEVFPLFDKIVYIVRDPRDRALSAARFALTPYMQQFYPTSYSSEEEYLQEEYETLLRRWIWHVSNYLYQQEEFGIKVVFYERLLENFEEELSLLLDYLGVHLTPRQQQEIAAEVSFSGMKKTAPGHVKKGKRGKWVTRLNKDQKEKAAEIAGPLMEILSYPLNEESPENQPLPFFHNSGQDKRKLKEIIRNTHWQPLFQ